MATESEQQERKSRKQSAKKNEHTFLVVGIGASAGGLKALETFFTHMPADSGIAFVIIVHLSPEHESNLAEILQRYTAMPVQQVMDAVKVRPNHIYIIPPAKHLIMEDGFIKPTEPEPQRGRPFTIDHFFRTLADAYNLRAIGIVMSGTGTDGTLGLRRIKEENGISLVQDLQEAEYEGMPRSAINQGLADFILPVAKMPEKLVAIRQTTDQIQIPPEGNKPTTEKDSVSLLEILTLLRVRTGHDFTNYKDSTILRRITRRMQVNALNQLGDYLKFMREHPDETKGLQHDLLITVTNFFRDHESFAMLEKAVVPKLFEDKSEADQIRVWVTGCATGEEAYSLAILLKEFASRLERSPTIQIFATDIDSESITSAREGIFPETISVDVTPERLKRFFMKEGQHYRIKKEIRETVLFAPHNILRDPPFLRLDLVSCRNLLIYLNRQAQDKVLQLFHYALKPQGFLFLGSSESADTPSGFFEAVIKKHRIFQSSAVSTATPFVPALPIPGRWEIQSSEALSPTRRSALSFGELHQVLVEQYAPPSVLINEAHDVVHVSEHAGRFLRISGGEPSRNLLKLVHPDLRLDLRAAIITASREERETETRRIPIKLDSEIKTVKIIVRLLKQTEILRSYLLVLFDEGETTAAAPAFAEEPKELKLPKKAGETEQLVHQLEDELQRTKNILRTTVEQYETSTEELQASNEELLAINEELRSASEELETSKEELQSLNEELQTVNSELNDKIGELSRVNSDLQNLLAATDVGTIFLDRQLRIRRFTPRAEEVFNTLASDIGRPLSDITNKFDYENFTEDMKQVMQNLHLLEREIRTIDNRWFIIRLLPYRTLDDRIDGVVMTFIEITERKRAEKILMGSEEHLHLLVESARDYAIFSLDLKGRITTWNTGAEKIFGYTAKEAIGQLGAIIFTPEDRELSIPEEEMRTAQMKGRAEDNRYHVRKDGSRFFASGVMNVLSDDGTIRGYVKITRDLTEQLRLQTEREEIQNQLETGMAQIEERIKERTGELETEVAEHRAAEIQIKDLLRRIVGTQELERQRISRDLHDQLGQPLTALRLTLASLKEHALGNAELAAQVEQIQSLTKQIDRDVDFLAWELRPAALDELGLPTTLENFVHEWAKHFNIRTEFHTSGLTATHLKAETEINLYRIAQEALNNIAKHAAADQVSVILEKRARDVVLVVEDNGRGFDPNEKNNLSEGLGLISMRERASLVGGALEIESEAGKGTTIFARLPIRQKEIQE